MKDYDSDLRALYQDMCKYYIVDGILHGPAGSVRFFNKDCDLLLYSLDEETYYGAFRHCDLAHDLQIQAYGSDCNLTMCYRIAEIVGIGCDTIDLL